MSTALVTLTNNLANRLGMGDCGEEVLPVLKATAFKGPASDAQLTALMIVANQYGLNPWTKEIYAFPDKNNGIVPVVGVDGWSRIINENPMLDGIDFEQTADECTCIIYRKDRSRPVRVTEYLEECKRTTQPWQSHPRRMLRHKALIQCARLAFGYVGIYDQDEAERIVEGTEGIGGYASGTVIDARSGEVIQQEQKLYAESDFEKNFPSWESAIKAGKNTADGVIAKVQAKGKLTSEQIKRLRDVVVDKNIPAPESIVTGIRTKAEAAAIGEAEICKQLNVETLDGITVAQAEAAIAFLNNPMGQ